MRQFMFRIWLIKTEEMIREPVFAYNKWFRSPEYLEKYDMCLNETEGGKYEVMQYTGLKDKDDKEIYEGDIVKEDNEYLHCDGGGCDCGNPDRCKELDEKGETYKVLWNGYFGGYFLSNTLGGKLLKGKDKVSCMAIIGNIHENSELLSIN
jgi:uncharacterized phage protein (TIGR01671 family)